MSDSIIVLSDASSEEDIAFVKSTRVTRVPSLPPARSSSPVFLSEKTSIAAPARLIFPSSDKDPASDDFDLDTALTSVLGDVPLGDQTRPSRPVLGSVLDNLPSLGRPSRPRLSPLRSPIRDRERDRVSVLAVHNSPVESRSSRFLDTLPPKTPQRQRTKSKSPIPPSPATSYAALNPPSPCPVYRSPFRAPIPVEFSSQSDIVVVGEKPPSKGKDKALSKGNDKPLSTGNDKPVSKDRGRADDLDDEEAPRKKPKSTALSNKPTKSILDILDDFNANVPDWQCSSPSSSRSASPSCASPGRSTRTGSKDDAATRSHRSSPKTRAKKRKVVGDQDEEERRAVEERAAAKASEMDEKERARAVAKAAKQLARDEAKAAREAEKSYQKKLNEANRLRKSKEEALKDIEIHLAHDLSLPTSAIAGALPEVKRRVEDSQSKMLFLTESETKAASTIRFLRHLSATWDDDARMFIPLDKPRTEWEPTTVIVARADDIVDLVAEGCDAMVEWLSDMRTTLKLELTDQVFLLIRGMDKYHNKTKSLADRAFRDSVRAGMAGDSNVDTAAQTNVSGTRVGREAVEDALLYAQLVQRVFVVHVEPTDEVEDWLFNLAADVALRPHKLRSKSHLPFSTADCSGKALEPTATLELMLQEIQGLTSSAASGISCEFGSFRELMEGYEEEESRAIGGHHGAEDMVADCEVQCLKNGAPSARRVGKSLSKKMYNIMRGDDPLMLT